MLMPVLIHFPTTLWHNVITGNTARKGWSNDAEYLFLEGPSWYNSVLMICQLLIPYHLCRLWDDGPRGEMRWQMDKRTDRGFDGEYLFLEGPSWYNSELMTCQIFIPCHFSRLRNNGTKGEETDRQRYTQQKVQRTFTIRKTCVKRTL